ncbi:EthD family reductase [Catalinimonas sp. 4WD22]|uniref:EthD family reductase n=1 Tax=Catalinimonas locisalis TaxID=3133978 RepID=UPI003101771E
MSKVVFIIFRKAGFRHEDCIAELRSERHVSIVSKVKGLVKEVLNDVKPNGNPNAPDAIGELWFDNDEVMALAMNSPEMAAANEDASTFLDMDKTYAVMVDEYDNVN